MGCERKRGVEDPKVADLVIRKMKLPFKEPEYTEGKSNSGVQNTGVCIGIYYAYYNY